MSILDVNSLHLQKNKQNTRFSIDNMQDNK